MLAQHLVDDFWLRVKQELEERDIDAQLALRGIADYRGKLASHEVNELIYHQEPAMMNSLGSAELPFLFLSAVLRSAVPWQI